MNDVAIRVDGLGKSYLIGHESKRERYTALRDVLVSGARGLASAVRDRLAMRPRTSGYSTEEFWALKDVSFEIRHGEVVGIIGRNGAGKSTLLKILSRITEPTEGRVTIDGRVASLLEVGTGFHPELTGRENIYLNGAILGMSRMEIRRKFDEIVDFAEVERFLDTPVKRYSSGMYVRLAFAVAAHLEPDILVVDEVLAVGDSEFQKKCLGKMQNVAGHGRTVLFVSHNMAAVKALCHRGLYVKDGKVAFDGAAVDALLEYTAHRSTMQFKREASQKPIFVSEVSGVSVQNDPVQNRNTLLVNIIVFSKNKKSVGIDIRIRDNLGLPVAYATLGNGNLLSPVSLNEGNNNIEIGVDVTQLVVGNFTVSIDLITPFVEYHDRVEDVSSFSIETYHWNGVMQPTLQEWGIGNMQIDMNLLRSSASH